MYGLEAIATHNGWAISVVGVTIVFTGLVLLSFAISQLHKLLDLWDNKHELKKKWARKKKQDPLIFTEKQKEAARQFQLLARTLDDCFSLPRLLKMAELSGLDLPHANLANLLKSGIIKADQEGFFTWDRECYKKILAA